MNSPHEYDIKTGKVGFKVTQMELASIRARANMATGGNVSLYLRRCILKPRKNQDALVESQFEKIKALQKENKELRDALESIEPPGSNP